MLIKFSGQTINNFFIPSFNISKGEIVVIHILGGAHFYNLVSTLVKILTGEAINNDIEIYSAFRFVKHFKENRFISRLFPITVGKYHRRFANPNNLIYKKIYDTKWLTPKIKVKALPNNLRRQLSLYTTVSQTNNIIFDLGGVDPQSGKDIYSFVKTVTEAGGAAILLDHCDEFMNDCTTFVKVKYLGR